MKFSQRNNMAWRARLMLIAFVIFLVACEGRDDNGSSSVRNSGIQLAGATTGKLMDAAVSGVNYSTSSKMTGITDEHGTYKYNHGDTVEFKLGSLVLGETKASAIVTPINLAGGHIPRLQNLLVLLQALDSDSEPGNGISISEVAAAAVGADINLDDDPKKFAASSALKNIREKAEIKGKIRSLAEINSHFLSQGIVLLSNNVWVKYDETTATLIRMSNVNDGEYLFGEAIVDDPCDADNVCGNKTVSRAGVEYGSAALSTFGFRGFKIIGEPELDTNLQAGLSHLRPSWRIYTDGHELITTDMVTEQRKVEKKGIFSELFHIAKPLKLSSSKEKNKMIVKEVRFSKMESITNGIIGAWVFDNTKINTQTLLFFPNGIYFMVDPVGDAGRDCAEPGVEFSSYAYDKATGKLDLKGFTYNTNGCAGFSDNEPATFSIDTDGDMATLKTKDNSSYVLHRVSR
ncbi:MAG: adhesin [Nitrosomonadaceae bacterium]|nr:adhesin [Nitrosomonadaceae bacterium]